MNKFSKVLLAAVLVINVAAPAASYASVCDTLGDLRKEKLAAEGKVNLQRLVVQQTQNAIADAKKSKKFRQWETAGGAILIALTYTVSRLNWSAVENNSGTGFAFLRDVIRSSPTFNVFVGAGIVAAADGAVHLRIANQSIDGLKAALDKQALSLVELENAYREKAYEVRVAMEKLGCGVSEESTVNAQISGDIQVTISKESE